MTGGHSGDSVKGERLKRKLPILGASLRGRVGGTGALCGLADNPEAELAPGGVRALDWPMCLDSRP